MSTLGADAVADDDRVDGAAPADARERAIRGGTLRAELPEDGGTRMVMSLPLPAAERRAEKPSLPSSQRSG